MNSTFIFTYLVVFALSSYILGSINSSIIFSHLFKLPDPRNYGSKNPGATNILRSGSKLLAFTILILDILKGFLPAVIAYYFFENKLFVQIIGFFAVVGHIFPIFYNFKGGKGVATALGAFLGFDLILGLICILTWLITAFLFRYSALSAIVSFTFLPAYTWLSYENFTTTSIYIALSIIIIYKHKSNIKNLINKEETKIGKRNKK